MIISASRRTDIPAHYSGWLFRRLSEGFVRTRNPMNPANIKRISLLPEDVDGIVFWSKDPAPMLPRLTELGRYKYYFQFTLTPYGQDIEPGVPDKAAVIETFKRLSDAIGPERTLWRYDPILINPDYPPERHVELFGNMAAALEGHTRRCTVSFVDMYKNTAANMGKLLLRETLPGEKIRLAETLARVAAGHGMELCACSEEGISSPLISRAKCIDAGLFNALWGLNLPMRKDRNQRAACGCTESVDIGAYNTCPGGCLYCYANYKPGMIKKNGERHDANGEFLIGI
jgi:hypothetical protein